MDEVTVYMEIKKERAYQDRKWGGAPHDDNEETDEDFVRYVTEYINGSSERAARHDLRTRAVKAAALCVALVEKIDRRANASPHA